MIVLKKEKIIALKARKVGGTSFEIALSKYADKDSIVTPISFDDEETRERLGWSGPRNYKIPFWELKNLGLANIAKGFIRPRRLRKFWNHMPAFEVREKLGERIWDSYMKIAIIRNPFDYMVSSYFWDVREEFREKIGFEEFVLSNTDKLLWNKKIYEIGGKNIIDFMIRYDRLKDDLVQLESMKPSLAGLAETMEKLNAKGNHRPPSATVEEMFKNSPRAHSLIYNVCMDDIERYNFEVP